MSVSWVDPQPYDDPAAGPATHVPDGVPALIAVDSPTMRLPRRYWTVVVHYPAWDDEHDSDHCGFEVYDEDGRLAFRCDHDGRTVERRAFLDGAAVGRGEQIAVRHVNVSDVTGVGNASDGEVDLPPVVREEWYPVEPYEST